MAAWQPFGAASVQPDGALRPQRSARRPRPWPPWATGPRAGARVAERRAPSGEAVASATVVAVVAMTLVWCGGRRRRLSTPLYRTPRNEAVAARAANAPGALAAPVAVARGGSWSPFGRSVGAASAWATGVVAVVRQGMECPALRAVGSATVVGAGAGAAPTVVRQPEEHGRAVVL